MAPKAPEKTPLPTDSAPAFAEVEVPQVTRTVAPNPYTAAIADLAKTMGDGERSTKALQTTLPKAANEVEHKTSRNRLARLLSDAGTSAGVSVRKIVDEQKDGTANVTFWTVKRITRERKETQESAAPVEAK